MTTDTIGKKEKKHKDLKVNSYQFGGSAIKKRKNMSLLSSGTQDTRIYLLSHSVATISLNKKQVKF